MEREQMGVDGQAQPTGTPPQPSQRPPQGGAQGDPWRPPPRYAPPSPPRPARMTKDQAVELTSELKTWLIAGSIMAFGVMTALVASHVTGATASAAASNASNVSSSSSSNDDNGGFFTFPAGSNGGFGTSPNAPAHQPISGSNVS